MEYDLKDLKIKPLSVEQLTISVDRLTRFKPTEEKYLRVFKDIIVSNLITPKFSKKQLNLLDYNILKDLAQKVINFSVKELTGKVISDDIINNKLLEYEKSIFKFGVNVENLLQNKIDYISIIKILPRNIPLNLKWLMTLQKNPNQIENRANFALKFPIQKVIIVEGITEEILLPKFARICGFDFDEFGINLISAGGKNQVVKLFYQYADILKLPIYVLLDKDGLDNYKEITPKLRKNDKVHVLNCGEFEDLLPLNLIKRTLNKYFRNYSKVTIDELRQDLPMTKILHETFKERGFEFKKAEFASLVAENISSEKDITPEIKKIISELN